MVFLHLRDPPPDPLIFIMDEEGESIRFFSEEITSIIELFSAPFFLLSGDNRGSRKDSALINFAARRTKAQE